MRKLSLLLCLFICTAFYSVATAQKGQRLPESYQRCATQEAIERRLQNDPNFRAMMEQRERDFQQWRADHPNGVGALPEALTGPVTIPVVVHIVLPNPNIVLESDVEYLINRLNLDFSGLNPDSTNGVSFYPVRGHSLIRFCLARRDPAGNFTNGIERRVGAGTIGSGEPQSIKSFAAGGLDPWNTTQYYNIWVGQAGGLLGIAPEIGPGTSASDGVCINYQAFANNPCYTIGAFNLGRTAVHEIGHNFGLWHTFQGGCGNADMQQLTTASCLLPAPVLALPDDTPGQSASTSGCPSGNVAAGCGGSPNPPGKQYQNYMDYTDDACYSMFSNTQVDRMHWVLENCRAGYLTANGCSLPASTVPLDAAPIEVISPGGTELSGCTVVTYNVTGCTGDFTPKVRIQNRGSSVLTSVTVQLTLNGTPLPAQTFAVSLAYGKSTVVTLNTATLISGANTLSFATSAPNGGADGNISNDALGGNYVYTPPASGTLPYAQDFVGVTFPPTGLTVVNPNGNNTWVRNNAGNGNAGSAFIDNYNFNLVGQADELRTTLFSIPPGVDSVIVEFDYAHKNFPGLNDRLQVLVSSDCGSTFTNGTNPVFDRSGAVLATAGSSTANYTTPVAADWQHIRLAVFTGTGSPYIPGNVIMVTWRATNGYSNNIFLENINIGTNCLSITGLTVTQPSCNVATGTIVVNATGTGPFEYSSDGGTTYQSSNTFSNLAPASYNIFVRQQGTGSCVTPYGINPVVINAPPLVSPLPASHDFVAVSPFLPTGWSVVNPNGNITWVRNNAGNVTAGSAFLDNYNFNVAGQTDEIRTVTLNRTGASFINLGFDLAHKNFPGLSDRLQVLYSIDCGNTWLATSFDRSGATLATAGSSTANYTTPAAADWVRQNVSIDVCGVAGNDIAVAFRATNGYGNNIFIDNINIDAASPVVNQPSDQTVCNGSPTAAVTFTGTATTYNWTNNNTSIGLGASGTGNIASFNGVNTGTSPVVATITVTPVSGTCSGTPVTFTITVNPTPVVNAVSNQAVCNGAPTAAVSFSGAVPGTIFSWTNNTPSIGLAASGTGNIGSFNAVNTGTVPVVATISVTPSTNSASFSQTFNHTGAVQTWVVPAGVTSINIQAFGGQGNANAAGTAVGGLGGSASGTLAVTPGETLNIYVGGGGATGVTGGFNGGGNGGTTGTCLTAPGGGGGGASDIRQGGTALSNRVIVAGGGGGSAGNRVTNCARGAGGGGGGGYFGGGGGSGYPGVAGVVPGGGTQAAGGAGGVTGTTFGATNGTAGAAGVGGAGGNEVTSAQAGSLAVAFTSGAGGGATGGAGAQSGANNFTGQGGAGGSSYIGGVTGGSTSPGVRSGNGAITISYTLPVTPVICTGTPTSFTITVNPTPNAVAAPASQTICSGATIAPITITGAVSGTTFNWTRNNTATVTGIAASGSGNIAGSLTNTTNAPVVVSFTITPVANGCTGTSITANVTVNPTAVVNTVANQTYCNGASVPATIFSSPTTGGTIAYNWTNNTTSIGLAASGTGNLPAFTATNSGTAPVTATITVTPTYTSGVSCTGTPMIYTITVAPTPTVDPIANQTVCNGSLTSAVNFTSPVTGTTFSWTNNTPSIGLAATGTGNIAAFTATNAATTPVTATVTVTPTITSGSTATIALPAQSGTFTGNVRGYWFTAPTSFAITSLFVPTDASSGNQSIAVVRFNGNVPPPVFATTTNAFTTLFLTQNDATPGPIAVNIPIVAGEVIGIMGVRSNINSYSAGPNNITIAGFPVSLTRMGMQFPLATTAPQALWQEPSVASISRTLFTYSTAVSCTGPTRTFNITVNPTPTITCPANITVPSVLGTCSAPVTYTPTVTGTPAPTLSYSLSGATTGSGAGSGSGLLFNVGTTTVTVTATNICGTRSCSFTITVTDSQIPVISQQPVNRTVCAGSNATFSVTATANGGPIAYQWQQWNGTAWVNITGATSSTYTITGVTQSMNTNTFRAVLTGLCSTVNSGPATLFVNPLPSITLNASPTASLLPPQTTTITATVNPPGGTIVWSLNGSPISGASGTTLGPIGVNGIGAYRAVYTDPNGCVTSSAVLDITAMPSNGLWVYPVPNTGTFNIRFYNQTGESATVKIYNAMGQEVYQQKLILGIAYSNIVVNMDGAPAGTYIVKVVNSSNVELAARRIVIYR